MATFDGGGDVNWQRPVATYDYVDDDDVEDAMNGGVDDDVNGGVYDDDVAWRRLVAMCGGDVL